MKRKHAIVVEALFEEPINESKAKRLIDKYIKGELVDTTIVHYSLKSLTRMLTGIKNSEVRSRTGK